MIIKCKMCGGDIQFNPGDTCGQCDHCGCTTTFPKLPDEQRANLFNRANHFRRQCEFDKAMAAYEHILEVDDTDAEAHWGIVLSKFGIEYVEDPVTHERIPTCHRAQVISILSDEDYQNAIKYAPDTQSREIYEQEAKRIAEIQKGILAISSQEKPYDVFICYKETDDNGSRTKDSALAQEIYYQLTNEGYKVFFSRITLEDKLGQEYEPYIFAALNSAKVMLVVGTKPENFSAVWVKNEWSRFLSIMKNDRKRVLIPCYRDMDPYDLPEELSALQSQDMSKIGFVQDLLRGIHKVLGTEKISSPSATQQVVTEKSNVTALLDRAQLALEDGEFERADEFCEQALNLDAKNSRAYLLKLMSERKVKFTQDLTYEALPLEESSNYQKALRFANEEQKKQFESWNQAIKQRIEHERKKQILDQALERISCAETVSDCYKIKKELQMISDFDGVKEAIECCEKKEQDINEKNYRNALRLQDSKNWDEAINSYQLLNGYRDSKERADACIAAKKEEERVQCEQKEKERLIVQQKAKEAAVKRRKIVIATGLVATFAIAVFLILTKIIIPRSTYQKGVALRESGQYTEAIEVFSGLGNYGDAVAQIKETKYLQAKHLIGSGNIYDAATIMIDLKGYKDVDNILSNDAELAKAVVTALEEKLKPYQTVGRTVTFGVYPQTSSGNDKTAIEWIVLDYDANNNKALLLSRFGLDSKPFNDKSVDVTWETCTLRTWLNNDFLNKAFSAKEKAAILTTTVDNSSSQGYSNWNPPNGNNTYDKVFLLSYAEANKYLNVTYENSNNMLSRVTPTAYTKKAKIYTNEKDITTEGEAAAAWFLRTPAESLKWVAQVGNDGKLRMDIVSSTSECIRPAIWLNLDEI